MQSKFVTAGVLSLTLAVVSFTALQWSLQPPPADIHVHWTEDVTDTIRAALERRYSLQDGDHLDGQAWGYLLNDTSAANIKALVSDPWVDDTGEIDRTTFRVSRAATQGHLPPSRSPLLSATARATASTGLLLGLVLLGQGFWPTTVARRRQDQHAGWTGQSHLSARERGLVAALLATLLVLAVASERHLTVTNDEPNHLRYGQNMLALDSTRFDDSKMPVSVLNALPGAVGALLPAGRVARFLQGLNAARYPTILFSLIVAICVFAWARRLYGTSAGLLALTLYTFDPNLIAHAQLVTTDLYAVGTTVFALYCFWRFLHVGGWRWTTASAVTLGLAQVAKYSLVLLVPLFILIAIGFHAETLLEDIRARRWRGLRRSVLSATAHAGVFAAVSLIVINASFLFNQTLTPLGQYHFESGAFRDIQSSLGRLADIPLPLPTPYLGGLDLVLEHERTGSSYGRLYLMGELRQGGAGFPAYYLWACLYKVPLATLAVLAATIVTLMQRRSGFLRNEAVLLLPALLFTIYFNVFNRAQIGIRYVLLVFPLLYILSGRLLADGLPLARWKKTGLSVAVVSLIASVLSYYPHFLPYFNELVWDRTQAYRIVADSNLDWGQYGFYMNQYRIDHPESVFEPDAPTAGTILVRVNRLTGVLGEPEDFAWLRDHFSPADHIAHGVLVYQVSDEALRRAGLTR